jgi:hypothetical protein
VTTTVAPSESGCETETLSAVPFTLTRTMAGERVDTARLPPGKALSAQTNVAGPAEVVAEDTGGEGQNTAPTTPADG